MPLTHGNYGTVSGQPGISVRPEEAFEAYHGEFQRYINTFAAMYAGQVKLDTYFSPDAWLRQSLRKEPVCQQCADKRL